MRGSIVKAAGGVGLVMVLSACVASPQYPVREGEAPGAGVELLQPRYPIAQAAPVATAPTAAAPVAPAIDPDAPRAAPSAEVTASDLPPADGAASAPRAGAESAVGQSPAMAAMTPSPVRPAQAAPRLNAQPIPYAQYIQQRGAAPPSNAPAPTATGEGAMATAPEAPSATTLSPPPTRAPTPVAAAAASPWPTPVPALETPRQVTVAPGQTLFDIAERMRTPVRAIIELNGLAPPYALAPGTVLRIPPPLVYAVAPGDTLFGVARRFNIDPRSLASLNDFPMEARLAPGQRVALPSLARDQGQNAEARGISPQGTRMGSYARAGGTTRSGGRSSAPSGPVRSAGIASTPQSPGIAPQSLPVAPEAAGLSDAQVAALGRGRFLWPVRGALLSAFGAKGPGQRNDGLNIAVSAGDAVKASAAGEVVYAGNSIPGFGNLVLVKHTGGWVTAYAHLASLAVRMRQTVTQGQQLGDAGQTGSVDRPQLHFEIRYAPSPAQKARPIDPASILPAAG